MGHPLRTDVPHSARVYDYVLGGKDNFAADRMAAEKMLEASPTLRTSMLANRRFMVRVAHMLAASGIRQFLDLGTGLPTRPNLHEVVHRVSPEADVVYVDNDPLVLAHARALLNPVPGSTGSLSYLDADLRDPGTVLAAPEVTALDLSRPVAVTMIAVLQLFHDDDQARALIDHYLGRLAPGSFLAISTVTTDNDPDTVKRVVGAANRHGFPLRHRTREEVAALFGDLEIVEPGIVAVHRWHPDENEKDIEDKEIGMYGGVAVKR